MQEQNSLMLSGFRSKAHLIVNYSFPKELTPGSLSALFDLYREAGFSFSILQDTLPTAYRHLPRTKEKSLPVIAAGECVRGTLLAKGIHVLFLPSLFPLSPLVSWHPFRKKK